MGPVSEKESYALFPNVGSRLTTQWFVATHYTKQIVTGHGEFKERLQILGLTAEPRFNYALLEPEAPEYILYEYTKYNSIRDRLREHARL